MTRAKPNESAKYTYDGMHVRRSGPNRRDSSGRNVMSSTVYSGVIESHRKALDATEDPDPVTQDMLIGQAGQLELFHWFVRAHLESSGGELSTAGATHEKTAARKAGAASRRTK